MPSAMDFKRSSLTLQPNLFQLFQPIGGVRATPLSHALASFAADKIARKLIARMTAPRNQVSVFIFMPPDAQKSRSDTTRFPGGRDSAREIPSDKVGTFGRPPRRARNDGGWGFDV